MHPPAPLPAALVPAPRWTAWFDRHGERVVWGMIALYVAVFSAVCLVKYRYYLYADFDLAIFTQATHQILHGSFFSSIRGMYWLGDHSSLILFLLAPLQAVLPGPLTLLFVQTVSLALGALAAWRLARHELPGGVVPVVFAALYLLHPAIGYTNLFEFHPETLSTSALLFTFLFLRTGSRWPMAACAVLALLCREDVALPVLMMGLYVLTLRRERRFGDAALLVGLAVISLVLSFAILKPLFSDGSLDYGVMYRHLGATPALRVFNVLTHPVEIAAAFFSTPGDPAGSAIKRMYHLHMLAPLLFLPLLSPRTLLIALPVLAEHLLSWRTPQHSIVFQYTALVTPILVAAAVMGTKNLANWAAGAGSASPTLVPGVAAVALAVSIGCSFVFGPLWGAQMLMPVKPFEHNRPDAEARTLKPLNDRMVARVPRFGGSVASFKYLSRLSTRARVHSAHHVVSGRYTFSARRYPVPDSVVALLAEMSDPGMLAYQGPASGDSLRELLRLNRLRPVDVAGDLVLFLQEARDTVELLTLDPPPPGSPRQWVIDGMIAGAGFDSVTADVAPGGEVEFRTWWRRLAEAKGLYLMDLVLLDARDSPQYRRTRPLGYGICPANHWPMDQLVCEVGRLLIPLDTPPGEYTLGFAMRKRDGITREGPISAATDGQGFVRLGTVRVLATQGTD
ncbi:MAG: DUF2079 domain-containing protein [Candidatus Eisenbacteria bacterium]